MAKRGPKQRSWQEHVMRKIVNVGEHMVWYGRYGRHEQPVYTVTGKGTRNAVGLVYQIINGQKQPKGSDLTRTCEEPRCVNPAHYRLTLSIVPPSEERDAIILELYRKHLKYKQYNMAGIGRKMGITRERVRQIVEEAHRKEMV